MTASSVRSKREKKKKNISSKSVSIYDVVVSFTVLVPFFILIMKALPFTVDMWTCNDRLQRTVKEREKEKKYFE